MGSGLSQNNHGSLTTSDLRDIRRQYQKLVQDLYAEEAKIQEVRSEYGKNSIKELLETIDNLIEVIKIVPPFEDRGESLSHYAEYFEKLHSLVDTVFQQLNEIADSRASLSEKDLRIQKLNSDLRKANQIVRARAEIFKAARNPSVRLKKLPYPEKDWKVLDEAIEQMSKEDLAALVSTPQVCRADGVSCRRQCDSFSSLTDTNICTEECNIAEDTCLHNPIDPRRLTWLAREKALRACSKQWSSCSHSCDGYTSFYQNAECMRGCISANESCTNSAQQMGTNH